ncbi:hypothetical protein ACFX1Q_013931 [Malus domestica]
MGLDFGHGGFRCYRRVDWTRKKELLATLAWRLGRVVASSCVLNVILSRRHLLIPWSWIKTAQLSWSYLKVTHFLIKRRNCYKRFNTRQQIHVKRSSDPDWLSTSLGVMLQIATIIESTESVLQELHNAIVDMICWSSDEHNSKTAIVEGYNSDKQKQLLRRCENSGVKTRLQIAYVEGAGRGAIAADNLKVGDTALEIPMSLIVSEELVQADMYHVLEKFEGITPPETMLLLWSMKERRNCDSKYKMCFDTLPEDFNTGILTACDFVFLLNLLCNFVQL